MSTQRLIDMALERATAIAWDGCHKIYIAMDLRQAEAFESYGYGSGDGDSVLIEVLPDPASRVSAAATLREWWDDSCGLRFINTVRTIPASGDPNLGFADIIAQGEEWVA